MKLNITKLYRSDKDKDGKPLVFKTGKRTGEPYTKLAIKAREYGDRWIGGFSANWNLDWQEGQEIDVDVVENGQWLNFSRPDPIKALEARVLALEKAIYHE